MTNVIAAFSNFTKALKIKLLMICTEIIALCSDIHTTHLHELCDEKLEFVFSVLVVRHVTIGL
jgi:hypothetical protein